MTIKSHGRTYSLKWHNKFTKGASGFVRKFMINCPTMQKAEFLKGATVQPQGRTIFFKDCARFLFLNAKMHNLSRFFLPFFGPFRIFFMFWTILFAQNFRLETLGAQKKNYFRKSGKQICQKLQMIFFRICMCIFQKLQGCVRS